MIPTAKHPGGRSAALALALAAWLPAPAARADEGRAAAEAKSSEELAAQAFDLYKKGLYADAVGVYLRAYQVAPSGVLLFNVARIYDQKLHDRGQAAEYYRRAAAAPDLDAELSKRAQARLAALRAEAEAPPPPAAAPPPPRRDEAPRPAEAASAEGASWLKTGGLLAAGVGAVGLGVGGAFGLNAIGKNRDADKLCEGATCGDARALTLTDQARDAAAVSTVCMIAGGALVAGGLTAFFLAPSGRREGGPPTPVARARLRVTPGLSPQGAGLFVAGRWP